MLVVRAHFINDELLVVLVKCNSLDKTIDLFALGEELDFAFGIK